MNVELTFLVLIANRAVICELRCLEGRPIYESDRAPFPIILPEQDGLAVSDASCFKYLYVYFKIHDARSFWKPAL